MELSSLHEQIESCLSEKRPELFFQKSILNHIEPSEINSPNDFEQKFSSDFRFACIYNNCLFGVVMKGTQRMILSQEGADIVKSRELGYFSYKQNLPIEQASDHANFGDADLFTSGSPTWREEDPGVLYIKNHSKQYDGLETISKMKFEGYGLLPLTFGREKIFNNLERLGVSKKLFEDSLYECPYMKGNNHYAIMPILAFIKPEHIQNIITIYGRSLSSFQLDMISETDLSCQFFRNSVLPESIMENLEFTSMFGHGYTSGCLPSDGSLKTLYGLLEYENLYLLYATHGWYNQ